jgi:Fic family protein
MGSRAGNAQKVLQQLCRNPIADAARIGKAAGVSPASAYKLIADLERLDLLKELTGGKRDKRYAFEPYLKLFR